MQQPILSNYNPSLRHSPPRKSPLRNNAALNSPQHRNHHHHNESTNDTTDEITYPQDRPVYSMDCVSNAPLSFAVTTLERSDENCGVGGMLNANSMAIVESRRAAEEAAAKERKIRDFRTRLNVRLAEQKRSGKIKTKAQIAKELDDEKVRKYQKKKASLMTRSVNKSVKRAVNKSVENEKEKPETAAAAGREKTDVKMKASPGGMLSSPPLRRKGGNIRVSLPTSQQPPSPTYATAAEADRIRVDDAPVDTVPSPATKIENNDAQLDFSPNPTNARKALLRHKKN
mgnify:CR=1 FL=1